MRQVANGGSVIDRDVVAALVEQNTNRSPSRLQQLTGAPELEVLEQMAQGRTNAGIAEQLHLSESSIEKYSSIFLKLGLTDESQVHRRVAAVLTLLHDEGRAQPL